MTSAPAFGARLVNVHIGSHRDTSFGAGVARLASGIAEVLDTTADGPESATLVLENSAGGGFGIGTDVDELAAIADAVAAAGIPAERVAFCLDTAHAWGAGIDISTAEGVDTLVEAFDRQIGLERLAMIHLNDSRAERGSRADRHEHLGAGRIGGPGLARVLTHPRLAGVATFLETPGMDAGYDVINLERAWALGAGRPLMELPAEAFDLPSSRSRIGPREADAPASTGTTPESRTPAPQTPAFTVPETRTRRAVRVMPRECSSSDPVRALMGVRPVERSRLPR